MHSPVGSPAVWIMPIYASFFVPYRNINNLLRQASQARICGCELARGSIELYAGFSPWIHIRWGEQDFENRGGRCVCFDFMACGATRNR